MNHANNQQKIKYISSYIVAALLSVFFLEIWMNLFFVAAPFHQGTLEKAINSSGIMKAFVETFQKEWHQELNERAMEENLAESLVENKVLYSAFSNNMKAKGNNQEALDIFQENLKAELESYIAERGLKENETAKETVQQLLEEGTALYKSYMQPVFIEKFYKIKEQTKETILLFLAVSVVCSIFSCVYLIKSNPYLHRGIRLIKISLISSLMGFAILIGYLCYQMREWSNTINPEFYQNMIKIYGKYNIQTAIIIIVVGVIGIVLFQFLEIKRGRQEG